MMRYKKMTYKELKPIFKDYQDWLSDWIATDRDRLYRVSGPIAQGLLLNRTSTGRYQPIFIVLILSLREHQKGISSWSQHLSIQYDCIHPSSHELKFEGAKEEALREVFPKIDQPLDPENIYCEYERIALQDLPGWAESYSLATLSAYFEKWDRFKYWKDTFETVNAKFTAVSGKDDGKDYFAYLQELEASRENGTTRELLEKTIREQKELNGIPLEVG